MHKSIVWDSQRDWKKEEKVLEQITHEISACLDSFVDSITSPSCQLIVEFGTQLQFSKLKNRLLLLKEQKTNNGNTAGEPYLKTLVYMDKILKEEFFAPDNNLNDKTLYEDHARNLFCLLNERLQSDGQSNFNKEQLLVSIAIVKEHKALKHLIDSKRELGGRLFFEEGYEKYFGNEGNE